MQLSEHFTFKNLGNKFLGIVWADKKRNETLFRLGLCYIKRKRLEKFQPF